MRRLHAIVLALCVIALPAALLSACSSAQEENTVQTTDYRLAQQGKLTFTASLHNTPFEDKTGYEAEGFSVEVAKLIAQEMGLECEFTASKKSDALAAGVQPSGDADVLVASKKASQGLSDSSITYTSSYFDYKLAIAVNKKDNYSDTDELVGKTIGVMKDSVAEDYVNDLVASWTKRRIAGAAKTKVKTYDTTADAMSDLQARNIDAVIAEEPVLKYYTRVMYYREEILATGLGEEDSYCFAVASDNPQLVTAVNEALAAIKESGAYQELYDSWFNVDETESNPANPTTPPQDQSTYLKGAE